MRSPVPLKILIIEDQVDVAANIWDFFERRGHVVDHAPDGESGLRMATATKYDTLVLDLGLPRLDGLQLCRRLRQAGNAVPIIMLTARDTLNDKLKGFAEGADDYLVKPFALKELEARVIVLSRQRQRAKDPSLRVCGVDFNPQSLEARREGRTILLTRAQANILECLMRHAPGIVEKQTLVRAAGGAESADSATLHTQIHLLRALIDRPFEAKLIHLAHGIGYYFGAPK